MAARTSRSTRSTRGRSRSRPDPPLHLTTLLTGQPKLISRMSKPRSWHTRAASAITVGVGAEELGGDGVLVGVEGEIALQGFVGFAGLERCADAVRAGELGHDEPAPAQFANEAAEYGIGHAGHGREHRGGGEFTGPIENCVGKTCMGSLLLILSSGQDVDRELKRRGD